MADKQSTGKKTKVGTRSKETEMASRLLKAALNCKKQSCGSIHNCEILCEDLHCGTVTDQKVEMQNLPSASLWCPTNIRCKPVSCDENKCSAFGK